LYDRISFIKYIFPDKPQLGETTKQISPDKDMIAKPVWEGFCEKHTKELEDKAKEAQEAEDNATGSDDSSSD
jgi:hypothetical protein